MLGVLSKKQTSKKALRGFHDQWQERYFEVCSDATLKYFKSKGDGKPKGSFDLRLLVEASLHVGSKVRLHTTRKCHNSIPYRNYHDYHTSGRRPS